MLDEGRDHRSALISQKKRGMRIKEKRMKRISAERRRRLHDERGVTVRTVQMAWHKRPLRQGMSQEGLESRGKGKIVHRSTRAIDEAEDFGLWHACDRP